MSLATLFGKLEEHELELSRLDQLERVDKKKKGIALKATTPPPQEKTTLIQLTWMMKPWFSLPIGSTTSSRREKRQGDHPLSHQEKYSTKEKDQIKAQLALSVEKPDT